MSVRETDRNIDKYIGIGFPLGFSNTGLFHQTKNVLEQASYNLRNLLLTSKGERVGQPDFGCDLTDVIFEQDMSKIKNKVEEIINEAVTNQLPYILINDIFVTTDKRNPNTINVQIEFSVSLQPDIFETLLLQFNTAGA
tara:strand:+ start:2366 stop:2782 length:417 start_codon:yes stop_codon:yes gene_type:complete